MRKKLITSLIFIFSFFILLFFLYGLLGGSFAKFFDTTKEVSFLQAVKDVFMTVFKGITNKF